MAYNTVSIQKDVDGKPIPQYYDPLLDAYRVLQGRNGANRVELYDADGNPIDLEALFTAIETILLAIKDTAGIKKIVDALPAGTNNIGKVTFDGSTMEYYGKSTDTKPTPDKVGATFFEIDTTTVFMWDGTDWVVI
jgi:hypothetical protein